MTTPNEKQLEAINAPIDANIRVLAAPGSGKTYILEHRYNHLVKNGIDPNSILVVTFSKSMADEMGQRILNTCPQANLDQISTIHAFCYRILASWNDSSPYYGWAVPKQWKVKQTIDDAIADIWDEDEKPGYLEVLSVIDGSKYHGLTNGNAKNYFIERVGALYGNWLYEIRREFDSWLRKTKSLTFADMLLLVEYHLKTNQQFKAKWSSRFPYIMIDEAQDTNYQAMRILLDIASHTFIVGDVDQLMYRFQGAKPELITGDYATEIQTIKLEKNYRSTETIIQSCQTLIKYNYSESGGPYSQEFMKSVSGVRSQGSEISFAMYPTVEDESQAIADTIQELLQNGHKEADFFIGARVRAQLGYLEGPLTRAGIKFINIAGGSFWQSRHVSQVIDYLRLAHDTHNEMALENVYNVPSANHCYTWNDKRGRFKAGDYCPTRYLGREFLAKIRGNFNNIDDLLFSRDSWRYKTKDQDYSIYGPTKAQDLQEFVWSLQDALLQADNMGQVIRVIIDDCYEKYLKASEGLSAGDESENGKLEDLRTVEDVASEYTDPESFLAFVDEMIKQAEDAKNGDWSEYVIVSTYHRLKGLERPVVFGTGWCEGISLKDGMPRGLLPHSFSLGPVPQFGVLPAGGQNPIEDERCIAFVAVSRAKDKVYLSGCERYRDWQLGPSRFIRELGIGD